MTTTPVKKTAAKKAPAKKRAPARKAPARAAAPVAAAPIPAVPVSGVAGSPDGTAVAVAPPTPVALTDAETLLIGTDPTKGRFEYQHEACGTIYADDDNEAMEIAFKRLMVHDPATAANICKNVVKLAFNVTPKDWKPA